MKLAAIAVLILAFASNAAAYGAHGAGAIEFPVPLAGATMCPDGKLIVGLGADGKIYLARLPFEEPIQKLDFDNDEYSMTPVCSANGRQVAIPTMKGSVIFVDRKSGAIVQTLGVASTPIGHIALSPDSATLAAATWDKPGEIWDVRSGMRVAVLVTDFGGCHHLAFSPDGSVIASVDQDTNVRFYSKAGQLRSVAIGLMSESFAAEFLPDGKQLVVAGADHRLSFLDPSSGRIVRQLQGPPAATLALNVSPDGKRLWTLQNDLSTFHQPSISLWDLQTGVSRTVPADSAQPVRGGWTSEGRIMILLIQGERTLTTWTMEE